MTSSRISYHVHSTFTPDRDRLRDHVAKLRPHFLLVSGEPAIISEIRTASPNTNIIWREGGDSHAYNRSPEEWLNERAAQLPQGAYLYTSDETPLNSQTVDWHLKVMQLAAERGIKLCVMNFGAGQPQENEFAAMRPVLDMLNAKRDLFVMGLREYAGGVITSGVIGGNPTMIKPDSWPQDVTNVPLWHMGRYRNLMKYTAQEGIDTPRLVITHHGFERMGDLDAWLSGLQGHPGFSQIRGWRSLEHQWMADDWFKDIYADHEEAYFQQLKWANDVLYAPFGAVEAQLIYSWGSAGQEEVSMDVSQAFKFQEQLESYASTQPDYHGYSASGGNPAIEKMSADDRAAVIVGFEKALAAGFLDGNMAASLQNWISIIKSS